MCECSTVRLFLQLANVSEVTPARQYVMKHKEGIRRKHKVTNPEAIVHNYRDELVIQGCKVTVPPSLSTSTGLAKRKSS